MTLLAFAPDGNKLIGLNNEGRLHIWLAPSWEEIKIVEAKETREAQR